MVVAAALLTPITLYLYSSTSRHNRAWAPLGRHHHTASPHQLTGCLSLAPTHNTAHQCACHHQPHLACLGQLLVPRQTLHPRCQHHPAAPEGRLQAQQRVRRISRACRQVSDRLRQLGSLQLAHCCRGRCQLAGSSGGSAVCST